MSNKKFQDIADKYNLDMKFVTSWVPPSGDDLRPLIAMPNIPRPIQGDGCQPRTIYRPKDWNAMRRECYEKANDTCEICGYCPEDKRDRHCLERGTEVLTDKGWKTIEAVSTEDVVAGFVPDTETIVWEHPTSTTSNFEEKIYRFKYKTGKGFSVGVSSGHRMLLQDGRTKRYKTVTAENMKVGTWKNIPSSGRGEGEDILSLEERLFIALQADGAVERQKNGNYYCRIRVSKKRKQERLAWLAKNVSIPIRELKNPNPGYYGVSFTIPFNGKKFLEAFGSTKMSYKKANDFIDELVKWDGWEGERNGCHGRCYYSSNKEDIDFVQAVCAQAGLGTHLTVSNRATRNWGKWHLNKNKVSENIKPSFNLEIKKRAFYGVTTMEKKLEEYYDDVFCISLPSTYFVARTKGGDVFITGNSHECFVIDYEKGTATFIGCFCLCKKCHLLGIHTGRAITLYSKGSPLISKDAILEGAEHAFNIISSYNRDHPEADLRAYSTFTEYLKHNELREPMLELVRTYGIKFYHEDESRQAKWKEWSVHLDGEEYPTPYKNEKEWEKAMEKKTYNDKFGKGVEINVRPLTDEEIKAEHDKLKQF